MGYPNNFSHYFSKNGSLDPIMGLQKSNLQYLKNGLTYNQFLLTISVTSTTAPNANLVYA